VHAQSVITTVAGTDWIFPDDGKPAIESSIGRIAALTSDASGTVYLGDVDNAQVMRISREGLIQVVAGNGIIGYSGDGGQARNASLRLPQGVAFDRAGNLYIASTLHHRIRKVSPEGIITI